MNVIEKAKALAKRSHEGQTRKYDGQPYIIHPKAVAKTVEMNGGSDDMIAAAWLHDVHEDCGVSIETIEAETNASVAKMVL